MPVYQGGPDTVAVTRAKLQKAGVPFNRAMNVKPAELRKAAADPQHFARLVRQLAPKGATRGA